MVRPDVPNNFGSTGQKPTHPETLDWLAATFVEQRWSFKAMHRLIMNSETYLGSFLLAAANRACALRLSARIIGPPAFGQRAGHGERHRIQAKEILRIKRRLNDLYVKYTGKTLPEVEAAMDRDTFLEAEEAKAFGLVDEVYDKRPGV